MNKYIFGDIITEKLKKEIGMIAQPLPEELKTLEKVLPSGRLLFESTLYKADKLKKISLMNHAQGENFAGTVIMLIADDEYDIPFTFVDIAPGFGEKSQIFTLFEAKPLVWDEESTRKYIDPFKQWIEAIGKLPAEPVQWSKPIDKSLAESSDSFLEPGEFLLAHASQTNFLRLISGDYLDEVLKLADQFFDIFLDIYRKAKPVKDTERRRKMDAFRTEYNKYVLDEDPSGIILIEAFGRQIADRLYDYCVYL